MFQRPQETRTGILRPRGGGQAPHGVGSPVSLSPSAGAYLGGVPKPVHHGRTWEVETPPPVPPPKLSWTNLPQSPQPEGAERGWGCVSPSLWTPAPSHPPSILSERLPHWPRGIHLPVPSQARGRRRPQAQLEAAAKPTGRVGAGWVTHSSLAALSPGHCSLCPHHSRGQREPEEGGSAGP